MKRLSIAILLAICQAGLAHAAEFQPNVTFLKDEIVYDVKADGTFTVDEVVSIRINTDQGVKTRSQYPLRYSASLQDVDVVEAYTVAKDGKRLDVASDMVMLQQSPQSSDAPMFDDGKVKTIVFPGVEIGATLNVHLIKKQKIALFPGHFSMVEAAWSDNEHQSMRITVRAPSSLKLFVDVVGLQGGQLESDKPEMQLWRWSLQNSPGHAQEIGSVGAIDRSPRVAVTTFSGYESAGAAYQGRAKAKSVVTPAIQRKADEITHGLTDKRMQAEALYRWVSLNIRYVAIYLNFGGVVPHDADAILDAKYGDCKDHVAVLEALLSAKDIKSSPVLVNATDGYWLPKVAVTPGVFNHVITYLPDYKIFLDSTPGIAVFGTLPIAVQGKSALVVNDGTGKPMIVTLPLSSPESDKVNVLTKLVIDPQGNVTGSSKVTNSGVFDWLSRQIFSTFPPGVGPQVASRVLSMTGQNGSGTYLHGEVRDLDAPFAYQTRFQLPGVAQFPGPGAMMVPLGLSSFNNIASAFEGIGPEKREHPMPYAGRRVTETIVLHLPDGVKVSALPMPAKLSSPLGTYESNYVRDGQTITVKRTLDLRLASALLQPDQYTAFRVMGMAVMRDIRGQLVY